MTPQPAGHSRQTVANHEATPGTSWSFGTTRGRRCSAAGPQPAAAAAAPVVPMILKKSRRFIASSVVTRDAVQGRSRPARGVLGAVTLDAPAHAQRWCGRMHTHEIEKIPGETRARPRGD